MESGQEERIVLCGANAYEKKYYFNRQFEIGRAHV